MKSRLEVTIDVCFDGAPLWHPIPFVTVDAIVAGQSYRNVLPLDRTDYPGRRLYIVQGAVAELCHAIGRVR